MASHARTDYPPSQLRGSRDQQMWNVSFVGEGARGAMAFVIAHMRDRPLRPGSIDVGGPYRESIANMCADLMSSNTPLFTRCANVRCARGMPLRCPLLR